MSKKRHFYLEMPWGFRSGTETRDRGFNVAHIILLFHFLFPRQRGRPPAGVDAEGHMHNSLTNINIHKDTYTCAYMCIL